MSSQMACMRRCIVTLVAFVCLFSTVRCQMCPQIVCPRRCIVILVAFVWLYSNVWFQMCPQIVCPRWCKVTLVAFVWLYDIISLFLQGFLFISLETKIIIFKSLIHCVLCSVQVGVSNWVKSMQWLLINNRKCQLFYGTLSLFHNWTADVWVLVSQKKGAENVPKKGTADVRGGCSVAQPNFLEEWLRKWT